MEENTAYREWYLNVATRFNQQVLLDNSIFELGESFDGDQYVHWINEIKPNFYIVPDVLEDSEGTISKWQAFVSNHDPKISDRTVLRIGVVQGRTWTDLVKCYRFMSENADYLAISFDYSYYNITGYGSNPLERFCSGRQRLVKQLIDEGVWNWNKPHHLLGASLAKEFRYYVDNNVYNIRSCDTSNPVVAGLHGLPYNGDQGLAIKPSAKLAHMIDVDINDSQYDLIKYNTSQFKKILRRDSDNKRSGGCGSGCGCR